MTWQKRVSALLKEGFEVIEVYTDGTNGSNEVSRVRLKDDTEVVIKVFRASKKYHQRRKALAEVTFYLLGRGIGGRYAVPELYAEMYEPYDAYIEQFGRNRPNRVCQVIREYVPAGPGDEWRGEVYGDCGNLDEADAICRQVIESHPDAERISLLDFLTINQDRSARNWVTDHGKRFYAIDNGMAWFHEYPEDERWQEGFANQKIQGCVVDDVLLQVNPWQFISGVFTTSWAGKPISEPLLSGLRAFDEKKFLQGVEKAARALAFPKGLSQDWRFEGILRRLRWMAREGRQPTAEEYRGWHSGSEMMTPPEIVETGGKIVWNLEMDK